MAVTQKMYLGDILLNKTFLGDNGAVTNFASISLFVPSNVEWNSERLTWSSNNAAGALASPLSLVKGGFRNRTFNGQLALVNEEGRYWTNTHSTTGAFILKFDDSSVSSPFEFGLSRSFGCSVRLIVGGTFTQSEFNDKFLNKTITYDGFTFGFVYNPTTQRVWLDRNLGAENVTNLGHLYQWGRRNDGHQRRQVSKHDGDTLGKPSTVDESGAWDGKFILCNVFPNDWLDPQDNTLWKAPVFKIVL